MTRFPPTGDGVAGPILDPKLDSRKLDSRKGELRPRGDGEPKLGLRPFSLPPFETALWSNGLVEGENNAPDDTLRPEALALVDKGDALLLAGLAARDPESRYLGGVMYVDPGVGGAVADGSSPKRARCVGVRGMSERLSFGRMRGYRATRILRTKISCNTSRERSGYVEYWLDSSSRREL